MGQSPSQYLRTFSLNHLNMEPVLYHHLQNGAFQ